MKNKTKFVIIFLIAMNFSNCFQIKNTEDSRASKDSRANGINGLTAEYFHNTDFSDLAFEKVDREINFNWEYGSPDGDIGWETFSVRWTGLIKPGCTQKYTFHTVSDDGVRLLIDNKVIIDNWTVHAPTEDTGTISLQANKYYSIKLEYYENYGGATIQLFWSSSTHQKEIIPSSHLYNNKYGLKGTYYNDKNFGSKALERVDSNVDFNWEDGSPHSNIHAETFSVRWTGYVKPEHSQEYTFYTNSDDGVRLWVNNQLLIDNWTDHGPTEDAGKISLEANKYYSIKLEYYESYYGAVIKLLWSSRNQSKEIIPYKNLVHNYNPAPGTDPLEYGMRNTILVPMPMNTASTWKDMAFLAAVPAGMKINSGKPSVIAMPDNTNVTQFHYNYLDRYKPTNVFAIGNVPGYSGAKQLNSSSLDDLTCDLARFWQKSNTVVMVHSNDYNKSLSASALAGRLNVPLFYWSNTSISGKTMDCFNKLGVKKAIVVGNSSSIAGQLSGVGISVETIANPHKVISWLVANNHVVDYFAVCNSYDRRNTYAPRSSLAAPLLAAARGGAVVPLDIATEFQTPCMLTETQNRPNGAAMSQPYQGKSVWKVGTCRVNGQNINVALSRSSKWPDWELFTQANIDFNKNGYYSDNGEFLTRGEQRFIGNKGYIIDIGGREHYADVRFSSPHPSDIKAELQDFHNALGHYPKYMALVGLSDTLPPLLIPGPKGDWDMWTDNYYSDVDNDPMYDIASGRIVGENVSYFTLNATRSITYRDLLDSSWMNRATAYGEDNSTRELRAKQFRNRGFETDNVEGDEPDPSKYSIFSQEGHGWPYGIAPQTVEQNMIPPSFTTTGGCSFGSLVAFHLPKFDYKDFTAVQLARTGAVGFHAFNVNAPGDFIFTREAFFNALFYQDATLGEANLYSLNCAKMLYPENAWELVSPIFYGDPALKLHMPRTEPGIKPARVEVNGNSVTLRAPDHIQVTKILDLHEHIPDIFKEFPYWFKGPGLQTTGFYPHGAPHYHHREGARFIAKFKVNGKVHNITQQSGIPDYLGWFYSNPNEAEKYRIDEHWDGTSTVYLNARFHVFNFKNGNVDRFVSKISYSVDSSPVPAPGYLNVGLLAMANNKYVCAEDGGNLHLIANRDYMGHWETFSFIFNNDGTISILSKANNKIVSMVHENYFKPNQNTISGNKEKFYMINNSDGTVSFKSKENGKYLMAWANYNGDITADASQINTWEKFVLKYK